jgi:pimeloyl-ACP methyl ester carboxylesterase
MPRIGLTRREAFGAVALASAAVATPAMAIAPSLPWTDAGDIAFGGGRLHYASLGGGGGPPLILLPKLGGWIADWRLAAPALATRRRVIALDPPGHGGSVMAGPPPYVMTMPECAAIVLAVLDTMGIDRFAVTGNSMGGVIGVVLAALWPHRVDRLVIVSSSLIGPMSFAQLRDQDSANAEKERLAKLGQGLTPEQERMRLFATTDPRVSEEQIAGRAKAGAWLRPCERGVGRVGVTDYLPRVAAPTLLINSDRGAYAKYGEIGRNLLPHAETVTIAGAGSFVHQERPAEVAAAINGFLDPGRP